MAEPTATDAPPESDAESAAPMRSPAAQTPRTQVPANRRRLLAQALRERGSLSVAEVEREFGVSSITARRDLKVLERIGLALRTYGGAMLPEAAATEGSFDQRMTVDVQVKERLARAAAARIEDGQTIFVDSSTAAFFATRELVAARRDLTVITNSLPVLELLRRATTFKVIGLGGIFDPQGARFGGLDTVRAASALLADKLIMSTTGITTEGWLSDVDQLEVELKRTAVQNSATSLLLITATDLKQRGLNVFAQLKDVGDVLHADDIDAEDAKRLRAYAPRVSQV